MWYVPDYYSRNYFVELLQVSHRPNLTIKLLHTVCGALIKVISVELRFAKQA